MVFFRKLFSHEINPANSERLYSLRKNSKSCHPERSEGSALAENKADSSPRQKPPGFGMTSFGLFPHALRAPCQLARASRCQSRAASRRLADDRALGRTRLSHVRYFRDA